MKNKIATCNINIIGSPIINLLFLVLWRIFFIVINIARLPPKPANINSVFSLTRRLSFIASFLSIIVKITDTSEITAK